MRTITLEECTVTVTAEQEDIAPEDTFATGDEDIDREICAKIRKDSEWNEWAWCCAKVTLAWRGLEAAEYLGGCSYDSKADFMKDGYYKDMVDRCLEQLNRDAQAICNALNGGK